MRTATATARGLCTALVAAELAWLVFLAWLAWRA